MRSDLKIVLLIPPNVTIEHGFRPVVCSFAGWGLMQVGGYLKKQGFNPELYDLSNHNPAYGWNDLLYEDADVIGIAMHTDCAMGVHLLCERVHAVNPKAKIIIGGHHPTHAWKSILQDYPYIYAVVVGEGEIPMANLVKGIAKAREKRDFIGVAYRKTSGGFFYGHRFKNSNLKQVELHPKQLKKTHFCFPLEEYARRLFPEHPELLQAYLKRNHYHPGCLCAGVITTRGCPTKCSFCTFEIAKGFRKHRLEYVLSILEWLRSENVHSLVFYDSTFLADLSHVEALCKAMIKNRWRFRWTAQTQVHHEDLSIISLMAEAGLVQMNLGLESGSPQIIREMNKNFRIEELPQVVAAYHQAGVGVSANIILGSPNESDQTIRETCRVFYQVPPEVIGEMQDLKLYPGSKWYHQAIREGRLCKNWNWKARGIPRFIFHNAAQIEHWHIIAQAHFRYARAFWQVKKHVQQIHLQCFPEDLDTRILVEALVYAFPHTPIFRDCQPVEGSLILYFGSGLLETAFSRDNQFICCHLNGKELMLTCINDVYENQLSEND